MNKINKRWPLLTTVEGGATHATPDVNSKQKLNNTKQANYENPGY